MKIFPKVSWLLAVAFTVWLPLCRAQERIWVEAEIKDQPVHLIFDTGASYPALRREVVQRFQLQVTNPPANIVAKPGEVIFPVSEKCRIYIWGGQHETSFFVLDPPSDVQIDFDGWVGWKFVDRDIFQIDARWDKVSFLDEVPEETKKWFKVPLVTNAAVLLLKIPGPTGQTTLVEVDTGHYNGVDLSPARWREWRASHTNQPVTLTSPYAHGAGRGVYKEAWAKELALGNLVVSNVPVSEAASFEFAGSGAEAVLGLAALQAMNIIVDGAKGIAYLHPKEAARLAPYAHNRIGAVFVPPDERSDDLIARVIDGGPAYEAGIRNGDLLEMINAQDVKKWRTEHMGLNSYWELPAGTRHDLTLKRNKETFKTTVELRDIVGPDVK